MEREKKNQERELLQQSLMYRDARNRQLMEQQVAQKRLYGEEAKMIIENKNRQVAADR